MLKPHIFKTAGRWGFKHPPVISGGWTPGAVSRHKAAAEWCRKRNLIEGNL